MVTTFQRQEPAPRVVLASAVALMVHYFDIREVDAWTEVLHLAGRNPPSWIRIAVIEALYQGRYKVISVQQILDIWRRRGRILSHFNREFEAIVTVPLPDRVQAHLRALAREHQAEHRQHRLREDPGAEDPGSSRGASRGSISITLPEQASPTLATPPVAAETVPPQTTPSSIVPLAPEPMPEFRQEFRQESRQVASIEDLVPAPEATGEVVNVSPANPAANLENSAMAQTQEHLPPDQTHGLATASTVSVPPPTHTPDSITLESPSLRRSSSQIDQFCPTPDRSGFDRKLLALANQS